MLRNPIFQLVAAFLALFVLLTLLYALSLPDLRPAEVQWAGYGTYIGGVMTPFAVLATLLALVQRDREHRRDTERLVKQGHKSDLLRFIELIEGDIEKALGSVTLLIGEGAQSVQHASGDALFKFTMLEWEQIIPSEEDIRQRSDAMPEGLPRYDEKIMLFETFSMVSAYLNRLRVHCAEYDRAAANNVTSLYFRKKYKLAVDRLKARGYAVDRWDAEADGDQVASA